MITEPVPPRPIARSPDLQPPLLNHSQLLAHFRKGLQALAQVITVVRRRDHHADACLAFGYRREADCHRKYAALKQLTAELLRQRRLSQHHRRDWGLADARIEAQLLHLGFE